MKQSIIFLAALSLLPQCHKKKTGHVLYDTKVVNTTGRRLEVSINVWEKEHKFHLDPNQTTTVALPAKLLPVTAKVHTKYGYRNTGIDGKPRRIKKNRRIVLRGEKPKDYEAKVMH